ncbi:adenosylcobinamide-GDP ribazoletransferase [Metabacillus arenae]|uniref:adenosylcobinamide-GDP ribazoletransferase n=1 Tax=Metabacillus arenae TaxID=2771434 RepID=UPI0029644168|nr:adenosylcobinamide-GDP ribazoletransferase [Metabacillus arenae]
MLLSFQFFTILPIKKELAMEKKQLQTAVQSFPFIGLVLGLIGSAVLYVLQEFSNFSVLAISFFFFLIGIFLTGGIHLDGWMDCNDAYFSYQSIEKRLEIMKDPRTGAFGVLAVMLLLGTRFLFVYESIIMFSAFDYFYFLLIPILSRMSLGYMLASTRSAKKEGLAYFFQKGLAKNKVYLTYFLILLCIILFSLWIHPVMIGYVFLLVSSAVLYTFWAKRFAKRNYGGITGDVLGATVEGGEAFLWMIVWLLHYSVMG